MAQRSERTKFVGPLFLGTDEYARLERAAVAQERDVLQQARWIIRQAVARADSQQDAQDRRPVEAGATP